MEYMTSIVKFIKLNLGKTHKNNYFLVVGTLKRGGGVETP